MLVPPPAPSLFQLYFVAKRAHAFSPSLLAPLRLQTSPCQPGSPPLGTQNGASPKQFPVKPVGKPGNEDDTRPNLAGIGETEEPRAPAACAPRLGPG